MSLFVEAVRRRHVRTIVWGRSLTSGRERASEFVAWPVGGGLGGCAIVLGGGLANVGSVLGGW